MLGAMTLTQRLQIKASEQRARLGELGALDELTPELRSELDTLSAAHTDTEAQLRAAIASDGDENQGGDPTVDPEVRERLELRGRASFGRYLHAALTGAPITGPEAEFQAACGVPGIPLDLFEQDRPPEVRADAASGIPATGTGATLAPIQPYVFAESIAPMLGIEMPSVGSGAYSEMTISTALTAAAKAKGVDQESTAAVLSATVAKPRSIRSRLTMNLEDIAEIGVANFESALRQNAGAALSDALDNEIINGDGSAPSVDGLIHQQTDPSNPGALVVFDTFLKSFSDQVDGLWASRMSDVMIVANVDAYKLAATTFRGTAAQGGPALTFADYAASVTGGFSTNARMPATAANVARGIVYRKGRTGLRTACLPQWGSLAVDDIYSDAASGQRHFTMNVLVGSKVLVVQPGAYALVEWKVS